MNVIFRCDNANCDAAASKPFAFKIKSEAWMDAQNIATVFCPNCKSTLVPETEETVDKGQPEAA